MAKTASIFEDYTERFFFVGGHTNDEFCTNSLKLCGVEELIHDHLQGLGYELIAFYSGGGKGLYFYDSRSYDLFFHPDAKEEEKNKKIHKSSKLVAGPVGCRVKRRKNREREEQDALQSVDSLNTNSLKRKMSDEEMLKNFDSIIKNEKIKSALIFGNFEDFINRSPQGIFRYLSQNITDWDKLSSDDNKNIAIFIIPDMPLANLVDMVQRSDIKSLTGKLFDHSDSKKLNQKRVLWITGPNFDEIEYIVRYRAFTDSKEIDWGDYEAILNLINKKSREESVLLKKVNQWIRACGAINLKTVEEELEVKEEKSGFEKLDEMLGVKKIKEEIERLVVGVKGQTGKISRHADTKDQDVSRLYGVRTFLNTGANLHISLTGNPGTGKTTIAKIIAQIFKENDLLDTGHFIKVTRDDLVGQYVGHTAIKTQEKIEQAMGGVLFIDEAYSLAPKGDGNNNDFGQEAIDTLVEALSDRKGAFSVIIAGYPDDIERLLKSNPGLGRRFTNKIFIEDYPPEVLEQIFIYKMNKDNYRLDEEMEVLLGHFIRNWFDARDEKNFGNAGDTEELLEKMEHSAIYNDRRVLTKQDIPEELMRFAIIRNDDTLDSVMHRLDNIIGLESVKDNIKGIIDNIKVVKKRGGKGVRSGHYRFEGNPGTGKTTVARIMGEIFRELKVLNKGHLVEVGREDLVAGFVGQTAEKTRKKLDEALGGVLFIDEAYSLSEGGENDFGKEAINTIVDFTEKHRDEFTLIAAGYPDDMKKFIGTNSGFESRFDKTIYFEDYDTNEMLEIFKIFAGTGETKYRLGEGVEEELLRIFDFNIQNRNKEYPNGRGARKVFEQSLGGLTHRIAPLLDEMSDDDPRLYTIEVADLPIVQEKQQLGYDDIMAKLDNIVGLESVKEEVNKIIANIEVAKLTDEQIYPGHYLFKGNPGTGKTTIARIMGEIFKELQVLKKGQFAEVTREDLVSGYVGQTAKKTKEKLEESLGGVLFIDEAYSLSKGGENDFGKEAIDTIVPFMENHRDKFTLIVAGYSNDMDTFLDANEGMRSRIDKTLKFEDYNQAEMLEIFKVFAKEKKLVLGEDVEEELLKLFDSIKNTQKEHFGNGREVRKVFEASISNQRLRLNSILSTLSKGDERLYRIEVEDLPQRENW